MTNYRLINCFAFTLLFALIHTTVQAQTEAFGTLTGVVYEKENNDQIPFANIFKIEKEVKTGTVSDLNGFYKLKLPVGKHNIKSTYIGYKDYFFEVEITEGESTTVNIPLSNRYADKPTEKGKPFKQIEGFWKIAKIYNSKKKYKRVRNSGIKFKEELQGMGSITYNDGCNGCGLWYYQHKGNGTLKTTKGMAQCTLIGCSKTDEILVQSFSAFENEINIKFNGKKKMILENEHIKLKLKRAN